MSTPQWWSSDQGIPPEVATEQITQTIKNTILNHPRSKQKRIGPSEIGTDCDHCLAAKLAGWEQHEQGIPWTTTKGTAIHAWLEHTFNQADIDRTGYAAGGFKRRWVTEETVTVGRIGDQDITGSTDLLDIEAGLTVDWKFVGTSSLRRYKTQGPSQVYRVQQQLYAHGWNAAGIPVRTVSICFLPAQSAKFSDHFWWMEPYQPQVAEQALARANHLWTQLNVLAQLGTQVRDQWITDLPRGEHCWDCARYPDYQAQPTTEQGVLLDLAPKSPAPIPG